MSQQAKSGGGFSRVDGKQSGYKVAAVDAFFTRLADDYELMITGAQLGPDVHTSRTVREASFPTELGGYLPQDVDRALDTVEDRFSELERSYFINRYGQHAWNEAVEELRTLLLGRLRRPPGERFRRPSKRLTKGYFVREVDELCERILGHLRGQHQLTPGEVRASAFSAATGNISYDETQVDAFLDRCIEYLNDTRPM
ncbi:DivIVA domain-containing protein [Rothia nasimurium]|uniref:DivIVA domain-containing protein n=1 Tax=Rothia nasimurium TaxID=85336 RepID=UPI0009F5BCB3|nr:DivIVA domain-containing protein [Rothia nasimurium]